VRARAWLILIGGCITLAGAPAPAAGQLDISGQVDFLALAADDDDHGLNRNFRSDSPYSQLRLRLFAQHWLTERIGVFSELLFDIAANEPRVNGAYVVVNRIAGFPWLNARMGMAPSPMGNFGLRDTYFNLNPVVGVPLIWQHRTTLEGTGLARNADLMRRRTTNIIGMPILYSACWNLQWELMGQAGLFEYSVHTTSSSFSNMAAQDADGVAAGVRVGIEPVSGIRAGVSAGIGPWIGGVLRDNLITARTFPGSPEDYLQRLGGLDLEVSYGKLRLLGEAFASDWESPLVTEKLEAWAAYGEVAYDVLASWQPAVRAGVMKFNEISSTNDGLGPKTGWDDDVFQVESAINYRLAREVILRANWQHTEFWTGADEPVDLLGLQLKAVF
jgi:hypothetical protein